MGAGDWVKSTKKAGCQNSKGLLDLWFAVTSECPYAKYPGFETNIPMWKEQIEDMPEYVDSGTTGRFKAKKGAGSICTMVKELVNGFAAGFPDSSTAPEASSVGGMKWEAPKGGWDFKDEALIQKGSAAKAAKAAAKVEKKWTGVEKKATEEAHKLNKAEAKLDADAAKASAKANLDLTKDEAHAAKAEAAADKSTAAAEKKAAADKKATKALLKEIKAKGGKASKARLAEYKKTMKGLEAGIAAGKKKATEIAAGIEKDAKELKEDHEAINDEYEKDKASLAKDNAHNA